MVDLMKKSFDKPDEVGEYPLAKMEVIRVVVGNVPVVAIDYQPVNSNGS